jgi:hypothetical protein
MALHLLIEVGASVGASYRRSSLAFEATVMPQTDQLFVFAKIFHCHFMMF